MALVALALAAAVASELLRLGLVAAGNNPSGATWALGMLASTVILASTTLGWLALAARALKRRPIADRLSATSALIGVGLSLALLASTFGIERLSAAGLLSSFRGRWILSLVALAVVVVLIRSLRHEAPSRRTAALAGASAAAGALGGAGLWVTVGAAGYQSFPSVATYWTLVVLTATAALATAIAVSLLAALRGFPLTKLLEVVRRRPVPQLPAGAGGLAVVTILAAVLRFSLLDHESFWVDEAHTVWLVNMGFGNMLTTITQTESNPPLYYILAWGWAHIFGAGEAGLRSMSAVAGTATVPAIYAAGRALTSRRVAFAASAIVAANPLLVNYSVEARNYALLAALGALSVMFIAWALTLSRPRLVWGWALASVLSVATHYFALFLILPTAVWLVAVTPNRRALVAPFAAVAAAAAALAPLALEQASHVSNDWIGDISLMARVEAVAIKLSVDPDGLGDPLQILRLTLLGLAAWLLLARASDRERRGGLLAGGLGLAVVLIPLALEFVGQHYFLHRNLLAAAPLFGLTMAAGFGAGRGGWPGLLGGATFVALGIALTAGAALDYSTNGVDLRTTAAAIGAPNGSRAVVVTDLEDRNRALPPSPPRAGFDPWFVYLKGAEPLGRSPTPVREIALVEDRTDIAPPPSPLPGFSLVERRPANRFTVYRYRSRSPVPVTAGSFSPRRLGRGLGEGLIQRHSGG
ncbi:MAG: glycosyltransferase family 39 protein [Thermoleophilaceae bacterium]